MAFDAEPAVGQIPLLFIASPKSSSTSWACGVSSADPVAKSTVRLADGPAVSGVGGPLGPVDVTSAWPATAGAKRAGTPEAAAGAARRMPRAPPNPRSPLGLTEPVVRSAERTMVKMSGAAISGEKRLRRSVSSRDQTRAR